MINDRHIDSLVRLAKKNEIGIIQIYLQGLIKLGILSQSQGEDLFSYFRAGINTSEVWTLLDRFRLDGIQYGENVCVGKYFYTKRENGESVMKRQTLAQYLRNGKRLTKIQEESLFHDEVKEFDQK